MPPGPNLPPEQALYHAGCRLSRTRSPRNLNRAGLLCNNPGMARQGTFEHEVFIRAPAARILEFLVDHTNHPKFHPLIVAVQEVPAPPPALRRFLITDRLIWGPFHFKVTYRADVLRAGGGEMLTEAFQSPGTYVTNHSTFTAQADGTRLHETITLRAPDLLFGYAFNQARTSHAELMNGLKKVLESPGAG
jgi:hypothetical protein